MKKISKTIDLLNQLKHLLIEIKADKEVIEQVCDIEDKIKKKVNNG